MTKIKLSDIPAAGGVRLHCNVCQHMADVDLPKAIAKWGDQMRLDQIERRAICTKCKSRNVDCRPIYPRASGMGGM